MTTDIDRVIADAAGRGRMRNPNQQFDGSSLRDAAQFAPYYGKAVRVKVIRESDGEPYVRTGRVGMTTGWKPAFLLVHRVSDHGSSDLLSGRDRIVAVQRGDTYVPVS